MLPPPPWLPFIEYVLMALEHPPHMFVSKLAACCTMLFLTRSDPELLRSLCQKWAIRFAMDRATLIARIRSKSQESRGLPILFSSSIISSSTDINKEIPHGPTLCDADACVEYFLNLVNTLVPVYFSWNWHRTDDVIRINKECEIYVREKLLPMCIATNAEEGISDGEETISLLPLQASSGSIAQFLSPTGKKNSIRSFEKIGNGFGNTTVGLHFVTLSNLLERMRHSPNGLVLIFHAKYSSKSCETLNIFQEILKNKLLNPEPTVCIIHAVTEPELANMFNISWFPTIIYISPLQGENNWSITDDVRRPSLSLSEKSLSTNYILNEENSNTISGISRARLNRASSPAVVAKATLCGLGPSPSELLYGVQSESTTPVTLTLPGSEQSEEEELSCIIERGLHRVYPANSIITIESLVDWINNKGIKLPPKTSKNDSNNTVSRIKVLDKGALFKKYRKLMSAVVMLRQLQCSSEEKSKISNEDAPVFIFLGGGMAAGKSTAATALSRSSFWEKHKANSVLVNADDFKVPTTPWSNEIKVMHECSTRAAEKLMVQAVNQGRNIVFDSTMMWRPFIKQVIDMVRHAHTTLYKQGVGYKNNGAIEEYFKPTGPRPTPLPKPYEIRMLAITVAPEIAVPRGILRLFSTGRGVPIPMQLRSFRLFAENFNDYLSWVDSATLYNNNIFANLEKGELPPVLAEKSKEGGLVIHDKEAYALFMRQKYINDDADNTLELYGLNSNSLSESTKVSLSNIASPTKNGNKSSEAISVVMPLHTNHAAVTNKGK